MPLTLEQQNADRERYTRLRAGWQPATARYEALIRERLGPGTRLLDLGCGRGGVLEQLGEAVGCALGLDPDHVARRAPAAALPAPSPLPGRCRCPAPAWTS